MKFLGGSGQFVEILGIDPGIAIVGYGVMEHENSKFRVIDYGAVTTPAGMDILKTLELGLQGNRYAYKKLQYRRSRYRRTIL